MSKLIHLSPKVAWGKITQNPEALFLDIRTYAENKFVGRPPKVALIPWIDEPDWEINPKFCEQVNNFLADKSAPLETEIILICRSGNRSVDAGKALINQGYTNISHVVTGFEGDLDEFDQRGNLNGWRCDGLPWVQC